MANTDRTSTPRRWMTAVEAASALGVDRRTLYAYVSRKLVRSQRIEGKAGEHCYSHKDIERLLRRREEHRRPDKAAAGALDLGRPLLETSLCLIEGGRCFYRGRDTVDLAHTHSLHEVASLLWYGTADHPFEQATALPVFKGTRSLSYLARAQALLAVAQEEDQTTFDHVPARVVRCGWRILHTLARAATPEHRGTRPIEEALARGWGLRSGHAADLLRMAMIIAAEHELNLSAFTARCAAAAGANPYSVVLAGLAALGGARHGTRIKESEALLASARIAGDARSVITQRLSRGERLPGFGHRLYPQGDPRGAAILARLDVLFPRSSELARAHEIESAMVSTTGVRPNLDFALATLARILKLPSGGSFAVLAIARSMGCLGHAIEQCATGDSIRPRARYVGPSAAMERSL